MSSDYMKALVSVLTDIKTRRDIEHDKVHVIKCPKCGGDLRYIVSSHNGHTRGRCTTKQCLHWQE